MTCKDIFSFVCVRACTCRCYVCARVCIHVIYIYTYIYSQCLQLLLVDGCAARTRQVVVTGDCCARPNCHVLYRQSDRNVAQKDSTETMSKEVSIPRL